MPIGINDNAGGSAGGCGWSRTFSFGWVITFGWGFGLGFGFDIMDFGLDFSAAVGVGLCCPTMKSHSWTSLSVGDGTASSSWHSCWSSPSTRSSSPCVPATSSLARSLAVDEDMPMGVARTGPAIGFARAIVLNRPNPTI